MVALPKDFGRFVEVVNWSEREGEQGLQALGL